MQRRTGPLGSWRRPRGWDPGAERQVRAGHLGRPHRGLRHQVESNRAMTRELVGRSLDAYLDLAYAPFSYYKEGLQAARKVAG